MQANHHQTATTTAGIGGPGFLVFAKYMEWQLPAPLIWVVGIVSCGLLLYSVIVYARAIWAWLRNTLDSRPQIREAARRKLIPVLIWMAVVASLALVAVSVTALVMYYQGYFEPKIAITVSAPAAVSVSPSPQPKQLEAIQLPPIPADQGSQISRAVKLKDIIGRAQKSKEQLDNLIEPTLAILRPTSTDSRRGRLYGPKGQYFHILKLFEGMNKEAYTNWPLDFENVPAPANPLLTAPNEEEFGSDKDGQWKYRQFYFHTQNAVRLCDAFISKMQEEFNQHMAAIGNSPAKELIK